MKFKLLLISLYKFSNAADVFPSPSPSNIDTSRFPAIDVLTPIDPSVMGQYDLSKVPNIAVNTPFNNIGPANCSASDPKFGQEGSCSWSCGQCVRPATDTVSCPSPLQWGLTFDDGPSPATPALLQYLASKDIRATFFVVGSRVKEYPQILIDIYKQGHQIAVHTWSHRALSTLTTEQVVSELHNSVMIIEQVIGTKPLFMRPPFGDIDDRIREILKAMKLIPIMWDLDTNDILLSTNPNAFPNNQLENLFEQKANQLASAQPFQSGTITLQHDLYKPAAEIAVPCIEKILATTVVPMPVSECLGSAAIYSNANLKIPKSRVNAAAPVPYVPPVTITPAPGSGDKPPKSGNVQKASFSIGLGYLAIAVLYSYIV